MPHARKSNGKLELATALNEINSRLSTPGPGPIPVSHHKASPPGCLPERQIEFAELQDGSLAELIEDPDDPAKTLLAVYRSGSVRCVNELPVGSEVLVPLPRTDHLSRHITLPRGVESGGGLEVLFADLGRLLNSCLDARAESLVLMVAHVMSGWFPEKLPIAPYLALIGPPGSGKTTALRILSLVCRRGLPTSDISSAAFYDLCHSMHPTILIDETLTAGHPSTLLHLLRCSSSRGFVALRRGKAQMAYGPKVLSWIQLPNDAALNSRCIIIPMHKTRRTDLLLPDDPRVLQFAEKLRMRLLQFRFEHYRTLSMPKVPADIPLSARALDLYRALALPFSGDREICDGLARLIAGQRQFQTALLSPPQASALRVLYTLIHVHPTDACFTLKALTCLMNSDLASRGEPSRLGEKKTGNTLTSLGLTNRGRVNPGHYVLWVSRSDRVRIHEMVRDYDVDGVPTDPIQNCDICTEKERSAATGTPKSETVGRKRVRSNRPKHERRERHERCLEGSTKGLR